MSRTKSPFERMEAEYEKRPSIEPFLYWVRLYHARGFVFSTPDFFVMGRAVPRHAPHARILDDTQWFEGEKCDCWYLRDAAGDMGKMWRVVPWELPWFCWSRIGDPFSTLQMVETARLKRLCPPDLSPR